MKRVILSSLLAFSLVEAGEGFIELGAGYMSEKDNFSTDVNSKISEYGNAESESSFVPMVQFGYETDLTEDTKFYTEFGRGGLQFGSEIGTDIGDFDFGISGDFFGEEWENPYLLNESRKTTKVTELGGHIGYSIPLAQNFMTSLKYEYRSVDYDTDKVIKVLQRDGKRHTVTLEGMYSLNQSSRISAGLIYETYDSDGEANSYTSSGAEIGISNRLTKDLSLMVMGEYGTKEYDKLNPIFNKIIDGTKTSVKTMLRFNEPMDYKDTYVNVMAGVETEDFNHDFYDTEKSFGMIGFGYNF